MRILLVTPFLPYPGVPHAGAKLVYHLLRTLARRHSVVLVSRCYPGEEIHLPHLRGIADAVEVVPCGGPVRAGNPLSVLSTVLSYRRLARKAQGLLRGRRFDLCDLENTETALFWRPAGVPTVMTCSDIIVKPAWRRFAASQGLAKARAWGNWVLSRWVERRCVGKASQLFVLSDEDREWAARFYPNVPCRTLHYPAGVDFVGVPRRETPGRVLFLGALYRSQNVDAIRYFVELPWPSIKERDVSAEFCVAGAGMPEVLRRELEQDSRIRVLGPVASIEEVYATASVFVAPILEGGGIIVKILDAMAAGVPVVTTPFGSEGIRAKAGEEILVAESPAEFAEHVIRLLADPVFRERVGAAGKRFIDRCFSEAVFLETLEQTYGGMVRGA